MREHSGKKREYDIERVCEIQLNLVKYDTRLIHNILDILTHFFARPNFLVQSSHFNTTLKLDNATVRISVLSY